MMFTHLAHPLTKGETVKATLNFEHAGPVDVEFKVVGVGASGAGGDERRSHGRHEDVSAPPAPQGLRESRSREPLSSPAASRISSRRC